MGIVKVVPPTITPELYFMKYYIARNLYIQIFYKLENGPPSFLQAKKRDKLCKAFAEPPYETIN